MSDVRRLTNGHLPEFRRLIGLAETAIANPVFSYVCIVALQMRVLWNVWEYKDLTVGDTASYFVDVASWAHGLHEDIVYSPLYAAVWGTILAAVHDVYAAATINRVAIILVITVLVLAVMRALFEPAVALLIAIWWAVDPANYAVLYDVHLFGLLPILIAALVVSRVPRRSGLGIAFALLIANTVLIRNETLVAGIIFGLAILIHELRDRRRGAASGSAYLRAYAVPIAIACVAFGGAYWRSHVQGHDAVATLEDKQQTNLCEAYAFNYQQRHPDRVPGNAFLGCEAIMQHDFGRAKPSLVAATFANPQAMAGFVAWNARLLPSGLEVALFDATRTGRNPGYPPPEQHRGYALDLDIVLLIVLVGGFVVLWRDRTFWCREWLPPRAWTLLLLGSVAIGTLIVVMLERPWVDYMFGLTIGVLVLVGLSLSALLRRVGVMRIATALVGSLAVALIIVLPSFYSPAPRPLYEAVKRVEVIRRQLQRPASVLLAANYNNELCQYLAQSFERYCTSVSWQALRAQLLPGTPVERLLARAKVTAIYADPTMVGDPVISGLLAAPRAAGWRQVASGTAADGPWRVLIRAGRPS